MTRFTGPGRKATLSFEVTHMGIRSSRRAVPSRRAAVSAAVGFGLLATAAVTGQATAAQQPAVAPAGPIVNCSWSTAPGITLEQAFARSAQAAGVPEALLKSVSYLQSRWDDHGAVASNDGGYGLMNLTDLTGLGVELDGDGKGDGSAAKKPQSVDTARVAAELTGLPLQAVKSVPAANICGGAAVLASYGPAGAQAKDVNSWVGAVTRYGGGVGSNEELAQQVFDRMRAGASRTTSSGQRVELDAVPQAKQIAVASSYRTDCPKNLGCEWLPAGYQKADPAAPDSTGDYGNHDLADRTGPGGPKLKYIVIHDTETPYDGTVRLAQDPTYLAWNYTIRSSDGHIAQHLDAKDVGWHAGNWYVNMHSIGIEHEGYAGTGGWFTEAMYTKSAALVKYLAKKYDIPLDREHVIGHDQVPGTVLGATKSVHWDPGPYWNWEHYFELLGAPIGGNAAATAKLAVGDVVTVRPGFDGNANPVTQCTEQSPGSPACVTGAGTNYAELRQSPSDTAPLAKDIGWKPTGTAGTTVVSDVSAKAQAGTKLVVAQVSGDWIKVSWAGEFAWIKNTAAKPVLVRTPSQTVSVKADATTAAVYGRAYPEVGAYTGTAIPVQALSPLEYTLKPGQKYAVTDTQVVTDYYYATSYDGSLADDRTDLKGQTVYYQISLAHRVFYVQASDVQLNPVTTLAATVKPQIQGRAAKGSTVTALTGTWTGGVKSFSYQWQRNGKNIKDATTLNYQVKGADVGTKLTVVVTAGAPNAVSVSATSAAVRVRA